MASRLGRTRTRTAAGIVLDTGALIALERGNKRMIALLQRALAQGRTFRVPAGVVGQVWRNGRVQVTFKKLARTTELGAASRERVSPVLEGRPGPVRALARFLRSEEVEIVPLDEQLARSCGELCGAASASDIIDASVVIVARERQDVIVTSDPGDLRRLDPAAQIITL